MPETLYKLTPDRDLQCYFERPSAIAAISQASATGFRVSGTWRQQFDWAVIEWNRDNVFEHPWLRNLPDGDLSGLVLSYEETRENCIPIDSNLFHTVDWPYLRIWTDEVGVEQPYKVSLADHKTAIAGSYVGATATLELTGTITGLDYVGVSFLDEHHTILCYGTDTLNSIAQQIVDDVNTFSTRLSATRSGASITFTLTEPELGANGNRLGIYGFVSGANTEVWSPASARFSAGQSPTQWRIDLDFGNLTAIDSRAVPGDRIRKMRWTYAAELQDTAYQRSEFEVVVSNWSVTGSNRQYRVAGPGTRRIEDDDKIVQYSSGWTPGRGNFSGGTITSTFTTGESLTVPYECPFAHELYLGSRYAANGAQIEVVIDGLAPLPFNLTIPGEDVLCRISLGTLAAGPHTITVTHVGGSGEYLYFDFLEIALPVTTLPDLPIDNRVTLATDWDTDHSIAIAPERTAWLMHKLGFHGRANNYVGALWFYEMVRTGHVYASATVDFTGTPNFGSTTSITIGRYGEPLADLTLNHLNRIGDTAATIAKAFELELNRGYTAVRAVASGGQLTVYARAMGDEGENVTVTASPTAGAFTATVSSFQLASGENGTWHTDLTATPRINRAARDWSRSLYVALNGYGIDVAAAFSTELQHGDDSVAAGIAQRYPNGQGVWLNTPALQTNFSPTSLAYWQQVHLDMAIIMDEAGVQPYLQFGEVQWWYFPSASGMTFYDDYTTSTFQATYGRPMAVITSNDVDPALHPEEAVFLAELIGTFTTAIMGFVRTTYPTCRFEVLYPPDTNNFNFTRVCNYPLAHWTPATLDCLKTESFTFSFERNLNLARYSIEYGKVLGFPADRRSFLVGIMDSSWVWPKEVDIARSQSVESIVLFALDQFCLIGYEAPVTAGLRRSTYQG